MNLPCADPLPHWIQYPLAMFLMIFIGFLWGLQIGVLVEHVFAGWIDRFFKWVFGERK